MIFGHKQKILAIVHVKFRDVTEIFILIKNFKNAKKNLLIIRSSAFFPSTEHTVIAKWGQI